MTVGDECYGCENTLGYRVHHEVVFVDSRTGRAFCHECTAALVTWELDGCPEPDEHPYPAWISEDEEQP